MSRSSHTAARSSSSGSSSGSTPVGSRMTSTRSIRRWTNRLVFDQRRTSAPPDALCESPCMRLRRKSRSGVEPLEIERAMEGVSGADDAETRSALFKALLNTTLVAATPTTPSEERSGRRAKENTSIL